MKEKRLENRIERINKLNYLQFFIGIIRYKLSEGRKLTEREQSLLDKCMKIYKEVKK